MTEDSALSEVWRMKGNLEAFGAQLQAHVFSTDQRFIRLEGKIDEGFKNSQRDREAGNISLGKLISKASDEISEVKESVNQGKGLLAMGDWVMTAFLLIGSGLVSALVGHVFFK